MNGEPLYVAALGASTPVGRDALSTAAAVRGGISALVEHPYLVDTAGEPMRAAMASWLDPAASGLSRFEALLTPAIDQTLEPLAGAHDLAGVAVALALPLPRPGLPEELEASLRASVAKRYSGVFAGMATFQTGHAGGLLALAAACRKLAQGPLDACIVAGVETYLEAETLEWIEACDQYHGAGPLNNAWGFIPGEGAGALLVARSSLLDRLGIEPLARVLACGGAYEPNRIKTDTVCIGEGLTEAFRAALEGLPRGVKVTDIYCDMNGEPYRADEYGFTALRTKQAFESVSDFIAPADCWGDVSAAGGPLHVGLAAIAGMKGYARGPHALAWASSESGERAAALLQVKAIH